MFKDDDANDDDGTGGQTRYPVMPSLVALQQMRNRLHLAFLGRKLMKWSALATGKELRRLAAEINETFEGYGDNISTAFIQLARARYFYPNMNTMVIENVGNKAAVLVDVKSKCVTGVRLLELEVIDSGTDPHHHLGIEKGGNAITEAKTTWRELLKLMILMLEQRISFEILHMAHKNATKKQNVLSKLIIPRIEMSLAYIMSELEEREREETFRLKRFKYSKTKKAEKEKGIKTSKEVEVCPEAICDDEPVIDIVLKSESDICCDNSVSDYDIRAKEIDGKFVCPICALVAGACDATKAIKINLNTCQKCLPQNPSDKERLDHLLAHITALVKSNNEYKKKEINRDSDRCVCSDATSQEDLEHIPTDMPRIVGVFTPRSNTASLSDTCNCERPNLTESVCTCSSLDAISKSSHTSRQSEDSCKCTSLPEPRKSISFNIVDEQKDKCSCSQGKEKSDSALSSKEHSCSNCNCSQTSKSSSACCHNYATYIATVSQVCTPFVQSHQIKDMKSNTFSEIYNTRVSSHGVNRMMNSGKQRYRLCYNKNVPSTGSVDTSGSLIYFLDLENSGRIMIKLTSPQSNCVTSNLESRHIYKKQNVTNSLYRRKHTPFIYHLREEIHEHIGKSLITPARNRDIASHSRLISRTQGGEYSPCEVAMCSAMTTSNTSDVSALSICTQKEFDANNNNKICCDITYQEPYTREGKAGPCGLLFKFARNRCSFHKIRCLPMHIRTEKYNINELKGSKNFAHIEHFPAMVKTEELRHFGISNLNNVENSAVKNQLLPYTREGEPGPCGYATTSILPKTLQETRASLTDIDNIRVNFDQHLKQEYPVVCFGNEFQSNHKYISSKHVNDYVCEGIAEMFSKTQFTPFLSLQPVIPIHYATCQSHLQDTEPYLSSKVTQTSIDYAPCIAKEQAEIIKASVPYLSKRSTSYIVLPEPSAVSVNYLSCQICLHAANNKTNIHSLRPRRTEESHSTDLSNTNPENITTSASYSYNRNNGSCDYVSLLPKILASIEKASAAYIKDASKPFRSYKAASGCDKHQPTSSCCKPVSSPQSKSTQYSRSTGSISKINFNLPSEKIKVCDETVNKSLEKSDDSIIKIDFGYFETDCQEITKISRLKNFDGTFTDEKQVITIRKEKKCPQNLYNVNKIGKGIGIDCSQNTTSNAQNTKIIQCISKPEVDESDKGKITKSNILNELPSRQISRHSVDSRQSNSSEYSSMYDECDHSTSMSMINAQMYELPLGHSTIHCHPIYPDFKESQSFIPRYDISNCDKVKQYCDKTFESYKSGEVKQNLSVFNCTAKSKSSCCKACNSAKKQASASTSTTCLQNENNHNYMNIGSSNNTTTRPVSNCCTKAREDKLPNAKCCEKPKEQIVLKGSDLDTLRKILLPSESGEKSGEKPSSKTCDKCDPCLQESATAASLPCKTCAGKSGEKPDGIICKTCEPCKQKSAPAASVPCKTCSEKSGEKPDSKICNRCEPCLKKSTTAASMPCKACSEKSGEKPDSEICNRCEPCLQKSATAASVPCKTCSEKSAEKPDSKICNRCEPCLKKSTTGVSLPCKTCSEKSSEKSGSKICNRCEPCLQKSATTISVSCKTCSEKSGEKPDSEICNRCEPCLQKSATAASVPCKTCSEKSAEKPDSKICNRCEPCLQKSATTVSVPCKTCSEKSGEKPDSEICNRCEPCLQKSATAASVPCKTCSEKSAEKSDSKICNRCEPCLKKSTTDVSLPCKTCSEKSSEKPDGKICNRCEPCLQKSTTAVSLPCKTCSEKSSEKPDGKICNRCEACLQKSATAVSVPCETCAEKAGDSPSSKICDTCKPCFKKSATALPCQTCAEQQAEEEKEKDSCCVSHVSDHSRPRTSISSSTSKTQACGCSEIKKTPSLQDNTQACRGSKPPSCCETKCFKDSSTSTRLKDRYDVRPALTEKRQSGKDQPKRCDCRNVCKCRH